MQRSSALLTICESEEGTHIMTLKAHILEESVRMLSRGKQVHDSPSEGECELEERHRSGSCSSKAMVHDVRIRVSPAQLGIDDHEPYCPGRKFSSNKGESRAGR